MAGDGSDDPPECPGHDWVTIEVVAARDGAYVERRCDQCGVTVLVGPDELSGRV